MIEEEDLDAVFIVGPPEMHLNVGLECLREGLHIFVEKPPAISSEKAKQLLDASRKYNRYVMVAFMKRFATGYRLAKQIIESKEFGKVIHISTKFANGPYGSIWGIVPPARAYLIGQAIHHFDLIRYFVGDVRGVYAKLSSITEDKFSYSILVDFESGATGVMNLNSCQSWEKIDEYVEITGDECFIFIDDMATYVKYYPRGSWVVTENFKANNQGLFWEINHLPSAECQSRYLRGYYGEIECFINSILKGREPRPNIEDGYKALRIAEAVWRSVIKDEYIKVKY